MSQDRKLWESKTVYILNNFRPKARKIFNYPNYIRNKFHHTFNLISPFSRLVYKMIFNILNETSKNAILIFIFKSILSIKEHLIKS